MSAHASKQPEPVLTRSHLVTVILVLSALLVKTGGGSVSAWLAAHADPIAGALLAAGPTITAVLARAHVTPSASPRAADGSRLVKSRVPATVQDVLDEAEAIHPA